MSNYVWVVEWGEYSERCVSAVCRTLDDVMESYPGVWKQDHARGWYLNARLGLDLDPDAFYLDPTEWSTEEYTATRHSLIGGDVAPSTP